MPSIGDTRPAAPSPLRQTVEPELVVVDGSNLATEGRTAPSLAQLDDAVRTYAEEHPDAQIIVVVDATFAHRVDAAERAELEQAELHRELVSPPAGTVGRGDAFILRIAERAGATVLSNDSFQEFHGEHPWLFEPDRLVGGKPVPGVGWIFTPRNPVRGARSRAAVQGGRRRGTRSRSTVPVPAATGARGAPVLAEVAVRIGEEASVVDGSEGHSGAAGDGLRSPTKRSRTARATARQAAAGDVPAKAAKKTAKAAKKAAAKTTGKAAEHTAKAAKKAAAKKAATAAEQTAKAAAQTATAAKKTAKAAKKAAAKTTGKAAEHTAKAAKKTAAKKAAKPTVQAAKARGTKAPATGATAKKAPAKKAPAKKAASPKEAVPTARRAPAKSTAAPKQPAATQGSARNEPLAFITFAAEHPPGSVVTGTVTTFTSHGALVDVPMEDGSILHCYAPLAGLGDPPPRRAREVVERGQAHQFRVVALDTARRAADLELVGDGAKR